MDETMAREGKDLKTPKQISTSGKLTNFLLRLILMLILIVLHISGYVLSPKPDLSVSFFENGINEHRSGPRAAIVDQLTLFSANQTFIDSITDTLCQGGYSIDYYPCEKVTVELCRNLPLYNYSILIFRAHSGYDFLFTSEKYNSQSYIYEQLADQVMQVRVDAKSESFFGIGENFIRQCLRSNFADTLIILMGCHGLYSPYMAEAFLERGASACVGWTGGVYPTVTDTATSILLAKYITNRMTLEQAISETMKEMGIDSSSESILSHYDR